MSVIQWKYRKNKNQEIKPVCLLLTLLHKPWRCYLSISSHGWQPWCHQEFWALQHFQSQTRFWHSLSSLWFCVRNINLTMARLGCSDPHCPCANGIPLLGSRMGSLKVGLQLWVVFHELCLQLRPPEPSGMNFPKYFCGHSTFIACICPKMEQRAPKKKKISFFLLFFSPTKTKNFMWAQRQKKLWLPLSAWHNPWGFAETMRDIN